MKSGLRSFLIALSTIIVSFFLVAAQAQVITTFAGTGSWGYSGDGGQATAAQIASPTVVAFDSLGDVYFPDYINSCIRKVNSSGIITTIIGSAGSGFSGDGGPASAARLDGCSFVTFRHTEMYIADYNNHRIRRVNAAGIISTIAGDGSGGFSGDGGQATAASLYYPTSFAFDRSDNMYIADEANDRIRKVSPAGIISTYAGGGSSTASGIAATSAYLSRPGGVATDTAGMVYICDVDNARICKVDFSGRLTNYAGTGTAGYGGDGGPATAAALNHPLRLVIDSTGTLYFGDQRNNRARKITSSGIISTIAGTGTAAFSGDGGPATAADVYGPQGVTPDRYGDLYIVDADNMRIRKIVNCRHDSASIGGADPILCVGSRDTLSSSVAGGSWVSSNPLIATVSATGVLKGESVGTVTIWYIVTNVCGSDTATFNLTVTSGDGCPTAVGSLQSAVSSLSVYPNPNSGSFFLHIVSATNVVVPVTVTDVLGRKVNEWTVLPNKDMVLKLDVPGGVYLLSAMVDGEKVNQRLVVE